jgi:hypothetical protein
MTVARAASYISAQNAFGTPFKMALRSAIEQAAFAVTPIMSAS